MKKTLKQLVVLMLAGGMSAGAMASSCDYVLSDYSSSPSYYYIENHPECFGASPQTSSVSINQSASVQNNAISTALGMRLLAAPPQQLGMATSGVAAATPGKRWNVWGNLTDNRTRQEYYRPLAGSNIKLDTDALTTVLGGDYAVSPTLVAGVSAAFDRASGNSYANGVKGSDLLNKGYMIAPYVGLTLSKELALDVSLGFGQGELSQTGNVTAEADRWFAGANLNYSRWFGNTQVSGRFGWMHGEEDYDDAKANGATLANTGAKNRIDQWRLGAQAAWWMNGVMPYVGLTYLTESRRTSLTGASDPIGKDAWQWSLGANFMSVASGVTGGIAYLEESGRSHQKNRQIVANIGLRF